MPHSALKRSRVSLIAVFTCILIFMTACGGPAGSSSSPAGPDQSASKAEDTASQPKNPTSAQTKASEKKTSSAKTETQDAKTTLLIENKKFKFPEDWQREHEEDTGLESYFLYKSQDLGDMSEGYGSVNIWSLDDDYGSYEKLNLMDSLIDGMTQTGNISVQNVEDISLNNYPGKYMDVELSEAEDTYYGKCLYVVLDQTVVSCLFLHPDSDQVEYMDDLCREFAPYDFKRLETTEDYEALAEGPQLDSSDTGAKASTSDKGKAKALASAKDYLEYTALSRLGLIDLLTSDGFSREEAKYAADNCGADWVKQAEQRVQENLEFGSTSYKFLVEQMQYEGFTKKQAEEAIAKSDIDWNAQAAKAAEGYLELSSFTRQELFDQLRFEGFTEEQAEYGVSAAGY